MLAAICSKSIRSIPLWRNALRCESLPKAWRACTPGSTFLRRVCLRDISEVPGETRRRWFSHQIVFFFFFVRTEVVDAKDFATSPRNDLHVFLYDYGPSKLYVDANKAGSLTRFIRKVEADDPAVNCVIIPINMDGVWNLFVELQREIKVILVCLFVFFSNCFYNRLAKNLCWRATMDITTRMQSGKGSCSRRKRIFSQDIIQLKSSSQVTQTRSITI